MREWLEQKISNLIGAMGIVGTATSEAGQRLGVFENVTLVQVVSMAGVIFMMVDRTLNSVDIPKKLKMAIWLVCWVAFAFAVGQTI